jgi:hypothetical protein
MVAQGGHKMYTGLGRTSLRLVLTDAHVALHRVLEVVGYKEVERGMAPRSL